MADTTDQVKTLPEAEKKKEQTLPFYQLFSFADKYDWLLMITGSIGAVIHGSSMPIFFLLFGEMVNGFGKNQMDLKKMTDEVSKVGKLSSSYYFKRFYFFFFGFNSDLRSIFFLCPFCSILYILCT